MDREDSGYVLKAPAPLAARLQVALSPVSGDDAADDAMTMIPPSFPLARTFVRPISEFPLVADLPEGARGASVTRRNLERGPPRI